MSTLDTIIKDCIEQHEGGEQFFDALDERIRGSKSLLHAMMNMISMSGIHFSRIIVSGKFGLAFKIFANKEYPLIKVESVNGSLRGDGEVKTSPKSFENETFVFVDDSFYSGTTRNKVKQYVKSCGAHMDATFVFYDGSVTKDKTVHSMYRYYK